MAACASLLAGCCESQKMPIDGNATAETVALYNNLFALEGTMFGHQDDTAYGVNWWVEGGKSDVYDSVGDYPAVYGWELGNIEFGDSCNLDRVSYELMRKLIAEGYERGGVITISWHSNNIVSGKNAWNSSEGSMEQAKANRTVARIIEGGDKHEEFMGYLSHVADFLDSLKDASGKPIPVIFRPWHEHTEPWFWWSHELCTREEFVALWRMTVSYLRDERGLHNLLYAYSPDYVADEAEYMDYYPGDEWVDILGTDVYHKGPAEGYVKQLQINLSAAASAAAKCGKPIALTETGLIGLEAEKWFTEVMWPAIKPYRPAYVLFWRNAIDIENHFCVPYPGHPLVEDVKALMAEPEVLFESELPEMYR